jgi:hypothetical protein
MARKLRIAAIGTVVVTALIIVALGGAFYAAQQVRPFYQQALAIEPEVLERGGRELESRATALYSDARQVGQWQALFTSEQINGWLVTQLAQYTGGELPPNVRDLRIAIANDVLTVGFRTSAGGVETVVSADAAVSLTDEGVVAIQLMAVRAGALPLPVLQQASELADLCKKLNLPVRWTRQDGNPVALVEIETREPIYVDAIKLQEGQLYVAGHTGGGRRDTAAANARTPSGLTAKPTSGLDDYELRLTPASEEAGLEIARRPKVSNDKN